MGGEEGGGDGDGDGPERPSQPDHLARPVAVPRPDGVDLVAGAPAGARGGGATAVRW